ncbi:hypothetical protein Caci_0445 [Catenulispora acidiphila DSM 44928]|uniref:Peptidase S8 and S53 subtilisin kexin sedolisin n=1 Tax=Catenulispora acidiphila (strain DSM 44928 / JCM 14897 / NBRC 102108 / NRRL B-24433 / ID139908) TaxID=479433 RepID=C7PX46_CATAD|nr:hypothetical protein [Catenulispora acidiphila]ACU69397.1 hypothetical protein Caci_0445 [Catenulispora acidiphila DSM 44928]
MRKHTSRAARAAALCAAAAAVATFTVPAQGAVGATPQATPVPSTTSRVTLATGDTVELSPAGTRVLPGGPSKAFTTFTDTKGDTYIVPAEAVPFAGRVLDMSLFDVTRLAAMAQGAQGSQIPVSLAFQAGVTPSAPAGVTLTAVSGQTATGYMTPASGAALATALQKQIAADKTAGRTVGSGGLLGLTSMRVAGTGTPVTPNYPMRILQINALDTDGAPLDSYVTLINTDNSQIMAVSEPVVGGVARIALPAGNYAAYMSDFSYDTSGYITGEALVAVNDFAVPATGDVPALTLDARTATAPVSVTTQQSSTAQNLMQQMTRTPTTGPTVVLGSFFIFTGGMPLTMTPQATAKVGKFTLDTVEDMAGPAGAGPDNYQYQYFLDFPSDHIDADQSHHPADRDLAAETENIDSDPALAGAERGVDAAPVLPYTGPGLQFGAAMPQKSTSYFTPGRWANGISGPWASGPGQPEGPSLWSGAKTYHAGQVSQHTWGAAPSAPAFGRYQESAAEVDCQVCVGAGNMDLEFYDAGDSNPDTVGVDFDANPSATFYWNGQPLTPPSGPPGFSSPDIIVPNVGTTPATVRAVLDTDRTSGEKQSTNTHTDVTFQYTGKTDSRSTLPDGNYCPAAIAAGQPSAPCQIMPVMTIGYQYGALSRTNVSQSPVQSLVLDIGHHSFGGHGSLAPVVSAKVSVSFDSGATWQDVPTVGAFGHYAALWHNPAPGTPVAVRVTAADSIGGSISQTVTNPYTVG